MKHKALIAALLLIGQIGPVIARTPIATIKDPDKETLYNIHSKETLTHNYTRVQGISDRTFECSKVSGALALVAATFTDSARHAFHVLPKTCSVPLALFLASTYFERQRIEQYNFYNKTCIMPMGKLEQLLKTQAINPHTVILEEQRTDHQRPEAEHLPY